MWKARRATGRGLSAPGIGIAVLVIAAPMVSAQAPAGNVQPSESRAGNGQAADPRQQAEQYLDKVREVMAKSQQLQDLARKQKDIIRLNCVNDKLARMKAYVNLVERAFGDMQDALARGDADGRSHEFARLSIASQKVNLLGIDAENCVGEELGYVGTTRVEEEVDDTVPAADPTQASYPTPDVTRPPNTSPYF